MSNSTDRIVFRMRVDNLISKYSSEDQNNILQEIENVKKICRFDTLDIEIATLVIYYYFKDKKKD